MSAQYIKIDNNGYIWAYGTSDLPMPDHILSPFDISEITDEVFHRAVNDQLVKTDISMIPPNSHDIWDDVNGGWIDGRDLDQKKADKWKSIKASRSAEEFGSFDWGGYTFQCDEVSQRRIQGAVQLASMSSAFSIDWTLLDNSVITLTADQMIEVGQTLASHVNALHIKARGLRSYIESATAEEEISSITW